MPNGVSKWSVDFSPSFASATESDVALSAANFASIPTTAA